MTTKTKETTCTFCQHDETLHMKVRGNIHGCGENGCGCAVYSSPESQRQQKVWEKQTETPVSITPRQLANKIHSLSHGGEEHHDGHSCPCLHVAMYYLGVTEGTGMFWPKKDGTNAWKR